MSTESSPGAKEGKALKGEGMDGLSALAEPCPKTGTWVV